MSTLWTVPSLADPSSPVAAPSIPASLLPRPLSELLAELVRGLQALADAPPAAGPVERWEGGGYTYFEIPLPGADGKELELTLNEGRAFIRMEQ